MLSGPAAFLFFKWLTVDSISARYEKISLNRRAAGSLATGLFSNSNDGWSIGSAKCSVHTFKCNDSAATKLKLVDIWSFLCQSIRWLYSKSCHCFVFEMTTSNEFSAYIDMIDYLLIFSCLMKSKSLSLYSCVGTLTHQWLVHCCCIVLRPIRHFRSVHLDHLFAAS